MKNARSAEETATWWLKILLRNARYVRGEVDTVVKDVRPVAAQDGKM